MLYLAIIFLLLRLAQCTSIVCTLATSDAVAHGVVALRGTLPLDYDLTVMVTPELPRRERDMLGHLYHTRLVSVPIDDFAQVPDESTEYLSAKGFRNTWYKLYAWNLVSTDSEPVDKLLFIDADTLIADPGVVAELLALEPNAFAFDTIPPGSLNTGVMLIRPSTDVYTYLVANLHASCDESDQGYVNYVHAHRPDLVGWNTKLNMSYNAFAWIKQHNRAVWSCYEPVKIVHFNTMQDKPYGHEARTMSDLAKNTAFSHAKPDVVQMWAEWRTGYCRGMRLVTPASYRVYDYGFCE